MTHQPSPSAHELLSGVQSTQQEVRTAQSRLISTCVGVGIVFLSLGVLGTQTVFGGLNYLWLCSAAVWGWNRSEVDEDRREHCIVASGSLALTL